MSQARPPLRAADLDPDPMRQFAAWFAEAGTVMAAPEAAAVATATPEGRPSVRMVLVKRADERGFVFYTNYESRKGRELAADPFAALLFYWRELDRQVRIEGPVARVAPAESAAYIAGRGRGSQLSALASPQSRPIGSREALERRVAELAERYAGADLPIPDHWGGFRLAPEAIEFWQQGADRLHDRLRYTRAGDGGWGVERLAP
ncbi:MAG TPA: pyridoxamine 5'-phosphate oxidase [Solirubrobacteraceae bacterium]|nr:pyridoxamine 5'-phosphate oxidase [Solirubrobacteraceae bacterium]